MLARNVRWPPVRGRRSKIECLRTPHTDTILVSLLNARTKCSAGRVERISRLAQVNPAELECLLWYSPPGVLDVSVSCSSRVRFGQTIQTTHFDKVPEGGTLWQLTHPGQIS